MNKRKILELVLLSTGHLIACIFAGAFGWDVQTVAVSLFSIIAIFYSHKRLDIKSGFMLIPVIPFFVLYTILSLEVANPLNYPVWICGLAVSFFTCLLLMKQASLFKTSVILFFFLLAEYFFIYPNAFSYLTMDNNPKKFYLGNSRLVNLEGEEIPMENLKGKTILFDIWHSACLPCIKQFPEIQKLHDEYKDDPNIRIVSLNFPLKNENRTRASKLTEPYTFEKMYFSDIADYEKFSTQAVPLILIMDKNMECRFAGGLNTEWNIFLGNAKRIINKLSK